MTTKISDERYKFEKFFAEGFEKVLVTGSYCYEPVVLNASHACDIKAGNAKLLEKNNYKGKFKVGDVRDLPYNDKEFDCVFCCEVLEHLDSMKDVEQAISEIVRVGKTWFISVPFENKNPSPSHRRLFTEKFLKKLLPKDSHVFPFKIFIFATNDGERCKPIWRKIKPPLLA